MTTAAEPDLYELDSYAWAREQAGLLRRAAALRLNVPLDWSNLAEEIDDLASARRKAVRSQIRRLLEHLLKLEHSRSVDPRAGWIETVLDARDEVGDDLTPTLRQEVEEELTQLYRQARRKAEMGLIRHREQEVARDLPAECPYGLAEILQDEWYPPNRHGRVGPGRD